MFLTFSPSRRYQNASKNSESTCNRRSVSDSRKTTILPFSSPLCVSLFHTISENYPPPQIEQQTKIASPGSRRFERKIGSRHGDPSSFGSASSVRPPRDKASGREGAAQKSSVCWRAAFRLELGVAEERRRYRGQWPHGAMVQCAIARKRGERRGERAVCGAIRERKP